MVVQYNGPINAWCSLKHVPVVHPRGSTAESCGYLGAWAVVKVGLSASCGFLRGSPPLRIPFEVQHTSGSAMLAPGGINVI